MMHLITSAEGFDDGIHAGQVFCSTAADDVVHIEEDQHPAISE